MTVAELTYLVDDLIRQEKSFSLYRLPGEESINFIMQQDGKNSVYNDLSCLNGKNGFVIAPFRITPETPLILIDGTREEINIEERLLSSYKYANRQQPDDIVVEYKEHFRTFIRALKDKELEKLVLSRSLKLLRPETFSPVETFVRAVERYIRSYVYICHTPQTGTWLGSTPEIILSGEGRQWHTVALAGTQPLAGNELPQNWDEKNKKEQQLVAEYIRAQLATLQVTPVELGPYTVRAAELAHLKSDFRFELPDTGHLGDVLKLLHPTPAVCGLPKEKAYRFILDHEGYDRRYYSGFVGMLDTSGRTNMYVNLRCMEINEDSLSLYAGGGLLASSTLKEEWRETEDKLLTMKRIMIRKN